MTVLFEEAIRELLDEYVHLQAEHQRLTLVVPDAASYEAHTVRLYMHVCRVQFVLEQLRQKLNAAEPGGRAARVRYCIEVAPRSR
jgi:hypothetical protein